MLNNQIANMAMVGNLGALGVKNDPPLNKYYNSIEGVYGPRGGEKMVSKALAESSNFGENKTEL